MLSEPWQISGKSHDLGGGMSVRRVLPQSSRRAVGPFVFLDHFGPEDFSEDDGMSVRPHPHIGLATMTYLFSGSILHRDSLGTTQEIRPGEINWMVAGRGIVHSERPVPGAGQQTLHGLQFWIALPENDEDCAPSFQHLKRSEFSKIQSDPPSPDVLLISGSWGAQQARQLRTFSPLLFAHVRASGTAPARLEVPAAGESRNLERAIYIAKGSARRQDQPAVQSLEPGDLASITWSGECLLLSPGTEAVVIGGEPLGPRHMEWNFVSTSREKINRAKELWMKQGMGQVPGETEWIPIPGSKTS